jgi:hypothetical protein
MASETEKHVQRYLEGVDYPASKDELVSAARSNEAPQDFIERLVDLPITKYSDPERVRESLDGLRRPQPGSEGRPPQAGSKVAVDDLLKERVMEAIRAEWDKTRPPGGVGTVNSKDVYEHLIAEGVDVPRGAMESILEKLRDEGRISGTPYHDPTSIPIHGAWSIIEPGWERL